MKLGYKFLQDPVGERKAQAAEEWINQPGNREKYLKVCHDYAYSMALKNSNIKKICKEHNIELKPKDIIIQNPNSWEVHDHGKFYFTPHWMFSRSMAKKLGLKDNWTDNYYGDVMYDYLTNRAFSFTVYTR